MLNEISEYTVFSQFSNKHFKFPINSIDCETLGKRFVVGCTDNGYYFVYDTFKSSCRICHKIDRTAVLTDSRWKKNDITVFCTSSLDGELRIYDVSSPKKPSQSYSNESHLHSCSFNCKYPIIACAMDNGLTRLYDLREKVHLHALESSYKFDVKVTEWSPDSEYLIACGDTEGHLMLYDTRQMREPYEYRWWSLEIDDGSDSTAHDSSIVGMSFSPSGRTIFTLDEDKYLRQWDVDTGLTTAFEVKMKSIYKRNRRIGICVTENNDIFVPDDNSIVNVLKKEKMVGHTQNVTAVTTNLDGFVSTGQDGFVCVWRKSNEIQIENDVSDWSD